MGYIWNEKGKFPSDILSLPPFERAFIYEATQQHIEAEKKAADKAKKGGRRK